MPKRTDGSLEKPKVTSSRFRISIAENNSWRFHLFEALFLAYCLVVVIV